MNRRRQGPLEEILVCLPELLTEIVSKDGNQRGFILCGFIDSVTRTTPDLNNLLLTCRRTMPQWEYDLFEKHFNELFKIMHENGHVPDDEFLKRGWPADQNMDGMPVIRDAGIRNERSQRAKNLTHPRQIQLRVLEAQRAKEKNAQALGHMFMLIRNTYCHQRRSRGDVRGFSFIIYNPNATL
eukprot:CAMPEP_0176313078 /NCGR_PEP_ID=MMETSP0121_2-20121125/66993_1 /TAXON_ID=160619 /ORGANISM="Kryptoperidinium foliaceum, Strain CCMP 1326" /LENGTH=182 /DNA_ID=CAMNT_0017655169 /DNA_START=51 /DNA_END=599 /DNA_ORIENTATION=+